MISVKDDKDIIKDDMGMNKYRGWYCFFHMNGPAELPMAYAMRTIAFVVVSDHQCTHDQMLNSTP
jgi:hypothetical protein